jgi:hypothetical protein
MKGRVSMTKLKSIVVGLSLCAMVLLASNSYAAPTILFNGAGSSAQFNTWAFAASLTSPAICGTRNWTKTNGGVVHDSRLSTIPDNKGNIWIVWDNDSNPTTICSYISVDSGVGVRAFFAVPTATLVLNSSDNGSAGDNLVPHPCRADVSLPAAVFNALQGAAFNAAMTDIRPEDALFATNRALAPLTQNRSGLGYGPPPVGQPILSAFSSKSAVPVQFALSGTDPISGQMINFTYQTSTTGASPVVVFANSTLTGLGHLGNILFTNIPRFVLGWTLNGNLSRGRDLVTTVATLPSVGMHVMLREPISGTYNTMEFCIPRSLEINSSQENNVTPPADNPLNQTYASGGTRQRVIGTGEMVSEVGSHADALGYAFWGFGNFAPVLTTTKYVTVDGIDPIKASYLNGQFPSCSNPPCPGAVTFPHLKDGTYPIWSFLRIVTVSPIPSGIQSLYTAALTEAGQIPDFVPANQMAVFRSHYNQSGVTASNGIISGHAEAGGDMGGAVFNNAADKDYFADTGAEILQQMQ